MEPFIPQTLPLSEVKWELLIPQLATANRALAYYDGILQGVANPDLLLSPLTTQEAVLSSRIEGTQATLGDVLKFEAGEPPSGPERREASSKSSTIVWLCKRLNETLLRNRSI